MTTPTHDPSITLRRGAATCQHELKHLTDNRWQCGRCRRTGTMVEGMIRWDASDSTKLSDAKFREIEERAGNATKGPMEVCKRANHGTLEYYFRRAGSLSWDSTLIERREDAEFYANALDDIDTLLAALRSRGGEGENAKLRELVLHAWVHSGYRDCGYRQMSTELKTLYCQVIGSDKAEHDAALESPKAAPNG